jgi:phosphatidylglycerol:prolipoprotein diacylglycerol transferase
MKPILIRFADGSYIHSGPLMLFVGGLAAILLVMMETKRTGERPEKIYGLLLHLMVSAVYGANTFYWLDFREKFNYGLMDLLVFWRGGMALYGGGVLAFITYTLYTRWQGLDFWGTGDLLAPASTLFIFFARVGCVLSGCCYGKTCDADFPLALTFTDGASLAPYGEPLYPTQPLFAATALAIFAILWARRKRKAFAGEIFLTGILMYALSSFVIEFLRADLRVLYEILGTTFSQNQVVSVSVFLAATVLYIYRRGSLSESTGPLG